MKFRRSIATRRDQYVEQYQQTPWFFRHPWIALLGFGVFAVGVTYLLYGLPVWKVEKVEIHGQYTLPLHDVRVLTQAQTQARWLLAYNQQSLWAFDTHAYADRLREKWILTTLKVQKRFPHTLVLTLVEEQPAFTLSLNGSTYGIDRKGVASNYLPPEQANAAPQLQLAALPATVALGDHVLGEPTARFLKEFADRLKNRKDANVVPVSVQVSQPPDSTARIVVAGEWAIVVDTLGDVSAQAQAFFLAYDQKLQGKHVQYVDVRVPDRVYYK